MLLNDLASCLFKGLGGNKALVGLGLFKSDNVITLVLVANGQSSPLHLQEKCIALPTHGTLQRQSS